mmetsp:Transcript_22737/g.53949  ORF Transcript_22737/g.53949 Transcript_22737/m.53949 type:complete len:477 (+) Transcript_22737:109-1539(+)
MVSSNGVVAAGGAEEEGIVKKRLLNNVVTCSSTLFLAYCAIDLRQKIFCSLEGAEGRFHTSGCQGVNMEDLRAVLLSVAVIFGVLLAILQASSAVEQFLQRPRTNAVGSPETQGVQQANAKEAKPEAGSKAKAAKEDTKPKANGVAHVAGAAEKKQSKPEENGSQKATHGKDQDQTAAALAKARVDLVYAREREKKLLGALRENAETMKVCGTELDGLTSKLRLEERCWDKAEEIFAQVVNELDTLKKAAANGEGGEAAGTEKESSSDYMQRAQSAPPLERQMSNNSTGSGRRLSMVEEAEEERKNSVVDENAERVVAAAAAAAANGRHRDGAGAAPTGAHPRDALRHPVPAGAGTAAHQPVRGGRAVPGGFAAADDDGRPAVSAVCWRLCGTDGHDAGHVSPAHDAGHVGAPDAPGHDALLSAQCLWHAAVSARGLSARTRLAASVLGPMPAPPSELRPGFISYYFQRYQDQGYL